MIVNLNEATRIAQIDADTSMLAQTVYLHTADDGEQFFNATNALQAADEFASVSTLTVLPAGWWS